MSYRAIPVEEILASLPAEEQAAIEVRGKQILAKVKRQMTMAELRKTRKVSQAAMAEALGIGQEQISRMERRRDIRLSTIERTIHALGGELKIIATFPGQDPIIIVPSASQSRSSIGAKSLT